MKTKSLYLAALLVIGAAVSVVAKDEPRATGLAIVPVKGSEVFKIVYKGESASKVKLNVLDASSNVIFSETLPANGFIRPLNFSGLAYGQYTIELTDASGKKVEKINYQPAKAATTGIHVSKVGNEQGKFLLAVSKNTTAEISVKIYDEANNLVHSESKVVNGDFAQLYTIKNVSGSYTFQVSDDAGNTKTVRF